MKITIVASLFAKGNMNINTCQMIVVVLVNLKYRVWNENEVDYKDNIFHFQIFFGYLRFN
jgi:hypothetical protein